jgi:hypothetical protein
MAIGTCKFVNSDIQRFFITKWDPSIITLYSADNVISGYQWPVGPWYEIKINTATITYSQELAIDNPNGLVYNEKIAVNIPKADNDKWKELTNLLIDKYIVIFQDANETWFTFGYKYGAQVRSYVLSENQYVISFDSPYANNLPTLIDDNYVFNNIFVDPTPTPTTSIQVSPSITPSKTPTRTPTASCARPAGLNTFDLNYAFSGVTGTTNFTGSFDDACYALSLIGFTNFYGQVAMGTDLNVGTKLYNLFGTSCQVYGDGYFVEITPLARVVQVSGGYIVNVSDCSVAPSVSRTPSFSATPTVTPTISITPTESIGIVITSTPTPTKTPTASPTAWGYAARLYSCNGINCGVYLGNAQIQTSVPLNVGSFYKVTDPGADIVEITATAPIGGSYIIISNGPYSSCNQACL